MKEYLDKEALYNEAVKWENEAYKALELLEERSKDTKAPKWNRDRRQRWNARLIERTTFKHYIADMDAADVEEVRHGHLYQGALDGEWNCSCCHEVVMYAMSIPRHKYCKWCGAKFDELKVVTSSLYGVFMNGGDDDAQT